MESTAEWLTGGGLLLEVIAAIVLSQAQSSILKLENWGYANPNPDVLKRAERKSRLGWLAFGLGVGAQLIRGRLEAWAEAKAIDLEQARPELPKGIVDRAADVWEPLLAVAEVAGGLWPVRARAAAIKLVNESRAAEPSLGTMLLLDIRTVFEATGADKLSSETIVHRLCEMVESPWGDLRGKPMDARAMGRRLRQFGLRTKAH